MAAPPGFAYAPQPYMAPHMFPLYGAAQQFAQQFAPVQYVPQPAWSAPGWQGAAQLGPGVPPAMQSATGPPVPQQALASTSSSPLPPLSAVPVHDTSPPTGTQASSAPTPPAPSPSAVLSQSLLAADPRAVWSPPPNQPSRPQWFDLSHLNTGTAAQGTVPLNQPPAQMYAHYPAPTSHTSQPGPSNLAQ